MTGDQTPYDELPSESLFIAVKALQGLHSQDGKRQVRLADVVEYVRSGIDRNQMVEAAIKTDLTIRRQLQMILQHQRISVAPAEALAQDSSELEMRIGQGFQILFRRSRANTDQVYVVLELEKELEVNDGDDILLIAEGELAIARLQFTNISNGRSQTILRTDDDKFAVIKNPNNALSILKL